MATAAHVRRPIALSSADGSRRTTPRLHPGVGEPGTVNRPAMRCASVPFRRGPSARKRRTLRASVLVGDVDDLRVVVGICNDDRPPGLVTRTISPSAASGSARCWKTRSAQQPSKLRPRRGATRRRRRRPREAAAPRLVDHGLETSTPTTLARSATRARAPRPVPARRQVAPALGRLRGSATRRLYGLRGLLPRGRARRSTPTDRLLVDGGEARAGAGRPRARLAARERLAARAVPGPRARLPASSRSACGNAGRARRRARTRGTRPASRPASRPECVVAERRALALDAQPPARADRALERRPRPPEARSPAGAG